MNYYEILGLKPTATRAEITKRYMDLVRQHHPDQFADSSRAAEQEKRMQAINEAYAVLRDPAEKSKYDASLVQPEAQRKTPPEEAKMYFGKGQTCEQMKDMQTAMECYKRAVALDSTKGQYFFHLARIESLNRSWLKSAVEHFEKAISLEPRNLDYHKAYIRVLQQGGLALRAQKAAQQALALAPADAELKAAAAKGPAATGPGTPAPQKSGVLGIFKKS